MNQNTRKQWIIKPNGLPFVIRKCSRCGKKTEFKNSGKFRVNANGRLLDIWLIYRCDICENSWNMTVWERVEAGSINEAEYKGFLSNDSELAEKYGSDQEMFSRNKAEVRCSKEDYQVEVKNLSVSCKEPEAEIMIPLGFELRLDALLSRQLCVSRSKIRDWWEEGVITGESKTITLKSKIKNGMVLRIKQGSA